MCAHLTAHASDGEVPRPLARPALPCRALRLRAPAQSDWRGSAVADRGTEVSPAPPLLHDTSREVGPYWLVHDTSREVGPYWLAGINVGLGARS